MTTTPRLTLKIVKDQLDALRADFETFSRPTPRAITTPAALDAALAAAAPGAVLTLASSLVYPTLFTLSRSVTLQGESVPVGRMTTGPPLPTFLGGIRIDGDGVTLLGLGVRHTNPFTDIVTFSGARVTLDRLRILGDPVKGAKRGIAANGNGNCQIVRCYIDDCFQPSPGSDSQAILSWDMAPGLLIEDNFLRAGSETIMLGGADSSSPARMPADVTIRGNTITANPAWRGKAIGVKTRLELKAARRVLIENNVIEYCWVQGQVGYLLSLTIRNQDGAAPWSTIEDVEIRNNTFAHGNGAINLLGIDSTHPSGRMARVNIHHNRFTDLDPSTYGGSVPEDWLYTKIIQITDGPTAVTLDHNIFEGKALGAQIYFNGSTPCDQLVVTNNTWPKTTYGIFGEGSSVGPQAWETHTTRSTLAGNTEIA